ncbi:hypothetical protein GXP67_23555 [Rhodocytophaga rosea]|uniref:Uncharacterized protein n=1 Tax=Rhodocytophaga rosea TaxID=2704465 RepID=A0A6C0GP54_9BACT|nr:hypothetical protein [Rhodocytophaga rosea]QHT69403.1 hypothetical protein GXP67_23555 [Rhodocytophaga rosea]
MYDVDLVVAFVRNEDLTLQEEASKRIAYFLIAKRMIPFVGLILGVGISFILARKQRIAIWNILIILMLSLVLFGAKLYEEFQGLSVGQYVANGPVLTFLLNAFVFLCLGFFIFFSNNISYLKLRER